MPEWYVYDKYGRRRKARPEEIPKPLIDHSEVSIHDGELILPRRQVNKNVTKKKKRKKRKKVSRV
jgi:hypothetical protein